MLQVAGRLDIETEGVSFTVTGDGSMMVIDFQSLGDVSTVLSSSFRNGWRLTHLTRILPALEKASVSFEARVKGRKFFRFGPLARSSSLLARLGLPQAEVDPWAALKLGISP